MPPMPRNPTPVAPLPITRAPAFNALIPTLELATAEPTELTTTPEPALRTPRRTRR